MHRATMLSLVLLVGGCAYDTGPTGSSAEALVVTDRCDISAFATLEAGDFVAGRARGGDTGVDGSWVHVTPSGQVVNATPDLITCRINGSAVGEFSGTAELDGTPGYTVRVFVQDRSDPGPPEVVEGPPEIRTLTATRYYRPSRWEMDSIEDRVIVTIPAELPVTVGNAGNQWAWVTFQRHESGDEVTCRYRGGASRPNPRDPAELAGGESYHLERCTGELPGTGHVEAGDRVDVDWLELRVHSGAHSLPSGHAAETTASVDLDVTPLVVLDTLPDYYRIEVRDASGARVLLRDGNVDTGDIDVQQLD